MYKHAVDAHMNSPPAPLARAPNLATPDPSVEDYNSLRPHKKTAWLKDRYICANPDIFMDLDNGEQKGKLKEYDNNFERMEKESR